MKGCEGSNLATLLKVVHVGSMADCGKWAMASRFQSLCVSLFDQASPGPQEHSFNTSSKGTKQPLSALSHPHPCLNSLTPRDKQWQGPAVQLCWGTLKRTLKRTGRSIKHIGDTLAVDKHRHNSMQHRLPRRWKKTVHSASGDKQREGSGIMGHWQLKSLCKLP